MKNGRNVSEENSKERCETRTASLSLQRRQPVRPHKSCWCILLPQLKSVSSSFQNASSFYDGRRSGSPTKPNLFPVLASPACFLLSLLSLLISWLWKRRKRMRRRYPGSQWKVKAVWWRRRRNGQRIPSPEVAKASQLLDTGKRTSICHCTVS